MDCRKSAVTAWSRLSFMYASATDGPSARDLASAKAASASSASGTSRLTRPSASQRRASIRSDRNISSRAPGCSHQLRQRPRDAVISRQPDAGITRGHNGVFGGNADIAGERQRKPAPAAGPGSAAIVGFLTATKAPVRVRCFVRRSATRSSSAVSALLALLAHVLDVTSGKKGSARTNYQQRTDLRIIAALLDHAPQRGIRRSDSALRASGG